MNIITFTSKLRELQGHLISAVESEQILAKIKKILFLKRSGKISDLEAGTQIRKESWKVSEDLRVNGIDLGAGSNQNLFDKLPHLLES